MQRIIKANESGIADWEVQEETASTD